MQKTKINSTLLLALALALALASPLAPAQETTPDALLQSITLAVITAMQHERDAHGGNATEAGRLVETKVVPLFDFPRMTQMAVARNWRAATSEQQTALTAAFFNPAAPSALAAIA